MPRIIDYSMLPEHMQEGAKLYLENGIISDDSFLRYVFENNLVESYANADDVNTRYMHKWAMFLYSQAPLQSWGKKEMVDQWSAQGGLNGIMEPSGHNGDGDTEQGEENRDMAGPEQPGV